MASSPRSRRCPIRRPSRPDSPRCSSTARAPSLSSQTLAPGTTSVSFPHLQPGSYAVGVYATYSEGISAPGTSAGVTLAPPVNATKPAVTGNNYRRAPRSPATPAPGRGPAPRRSPSTWLRSGIATGTTTSTYRLTTDDAGKSITCRVVLTASTGPTATAQSAHVLAHAKLGVRAAPRVTGSRAVGTKLVCHPGTWNHTGALKLELPLAAQRQAARRAFAAPHRRGRRCEPPAARVA